MPELSGLARLPALAVTAACAALACGRPLDDEECRRLLDRYTELLVKEEEPGAGPERVAHQQTEARSVAREDPRFEFSTCSRHVSRHSYDCAMTAPSVDAVEQCLMF